MSSLTTSTISSWRSLLLFTVLTTTTIAQRVTDPATLGATIKAEKNYSLLPGCINQCIWDIGDDDTRALSGDLAVHLSCSSPWINGCYCRPNSASYAHGFISSCATMLCSTPAAEDVARGTSVYASYCSQALGAAYTPGAVGQAPGPTPAAAPNSGVAAATTRPTSSAPRQTSAGSSASASSNSNTASGSSNASNSSGDEKIAGLSKGAFIGVVASVSCSVIGLVFGIFFKIYKHKKQQKQQAQMHDGVTGVYYTTKQ